MVCKLNSKSYKRIKIATIVWAPTVKTLERKMSVRFYDAHYVLVRTCISFFSINFTCNSCFINIKVVYVWLRRHQSTIFLSMTESPEARMSPASREINENGDKYVVAVTPYRSPNRRCLVFILTFVALVAIAVLLATLIPTYVKGSGEDKSSHGKLHSFYSIRIQFHLYEYLG